ncbi:Aste57867_10549 [Aphanomyces stellatus]|uniref:Aste57867_10549 protein n=1 Tax=Aphanomyces stellatus TaxID=120398 RepID=A0A485KR38_9STRA|nr:hypothetical protein As57867_010509 [Aphanomyces stellatus]VFT87422.1 Aste57867_10549 [Aphanomyces stellatus]
MKTSLFLCASVASTAMVAQAINPLEIKGTRFFEVGTGKPFQIKGVDYYPRPNAGKDDVNNHDVFTDDYQSVWQPHIQEFVALGVNTIRLYAVDASKSHDKFMCALSAAGIYVIVDLAAACENCAIGMTSYPACYPPQLKTRGQQIIAAFSKFNNVLGFSAGNEVNHVVKDMKTNAPCQKKFIRDMRAYIDSCAANMRYIPVGVVLADSDRDINALYYGCRTDPTDALENAEWYGLNAYLQCDPAASLSPATVGAGYRKLLSDFTSYQLPVPSIMTEYGCLNVGFATINGFAAQRTWLDAGWLLSQSFVDVFAGGLAFEFSTENANSKADAPFPFTSFGTQNYGLGYFDPATCEGTAASPCTYKRMPNFDLLATQYNASTTVSLPLKTAYTPSITTFPTCPATVATLKSIVWPSDATSDMLCPDLTQTPLCPGDVIYTGKGKPIVTPTKNTVAPIPGLPTAAPTPKTPAGGGSSQYQSSAHALGPSFLVASGVMAAALAFSLP